MKWKSIEGVKKDTELENLSLVKKTEWLQFLLKTNCIVFGVIVALYQGSFTSGARYSFAAAVVLLALSILLLGICLYALLSS